MLAEGGLLIAVSWSPVLPRGLQPANASLPGSAAANACFRLLKNQPQQRHRWPPPTTPASYFTSIRPPQGFHPSLLAISPSRLSPSHHARPRAMRSAVCLITRTTEERVCHVPLMVPGKGRPAVGTGRGCSWTLYLVQKSFLVPRSRRPVDRWDVQACYIVECERNSAGGKKTPPHSDILDFSCHTNSEFMPQWRFFFLKKQSQIQCKERQCLQVFHSTTEESGGQICYYQSRIRKQMLGSSSLHLLCPPVLFSIFLLKLRFWKYDQPSRELRIC